MDREFFMIKLILIRHGETDYNLQNRYCGFSDPSLNDRGVWQAERLVCRLRSEKVDMIYSSDLKRTYETAKIVFKNKIIEKVTDFREMNFGIFDGLTHSEITQRHPELYKRWLSNPTRIKTPGGEGLKDLSKRVKEILSLILAQHQDKTIGIISHGGSIRVILCAALKYSLKMFWQIEQDIGALNIIEYSEKSEPRVVKMNDTSHLLIKEKIAL